MRSAKLIIAIFVLLSIVLSACSGTRVSGPIVKIGWTDEPDSLNPGMAILTASYSIFGLIYDTLYELNLDGSYSFSLAESVNVSDDGRVWTFKIRDGVKFSDGQPLTADDVVYSFNLYAEHPEEYVYMPTYTAYFESVEVLPENQVVIRLTQAIPNMEGQLSTLFVLPKHIWEAMEDPTVKELALEQSIGSGPFELVEYVKGQYLKLESNPKHFTGGPKIGGVEFRIYDDLSSLITALSEKEVDLIVNLPVEAVSAVNGLAGVQVVAGPPVSPSVSDIIINQMSPERCPTDVGGLCTGHPALQDRNVRLALAHAVDKHRLIDEVMLGLADPGLTLIPKGMGTFYNSSIKDYEYDLETANTILEKAGYLDTNGDGVREMPDSSRELSFRLQWPDSNQYARTEAKLLELMWAQIGIDVVMEQVDSDALTERCCPAFDYDILIWEWNSDPDPNFLLSVMLTDEIPSGYNESGYSNPEYDELYQKQATELDDEARHALIWRMQDIVHEDVVYIIPFYQRSVQAYRDDTFRGWLTDSGNLDLSARSSLTVITPLGQ